MAFLLTLEPLVIATLALAAFLLGAAKTSFPTATIIVVPIVALVLDSRAAAGILLPVYVVGDIVAIALYHRESEPSKVLRLLPWAAAGIALAVFFGARVDETTFQRVLGVLVLMTVVMTVVIRLGAESPVPRWLAPPIGIIAGFTTMIGNAAGPIMTIYLLAMGLTTRSFVGTAAILFGVLNLAKIPLHLFVWQSFPLNGLLVSLLVLPIALLGTWTGATLLRRVSPRLFRLVMLSTAAIAGLRLLLG